jgi:hypothetical protein
LQPAFHPQHGSDAGLFFDEHEKDVGVGWKKKPSYLHIKERYKAGDRGCDDHEQGYGASNDNHF